MDKNNTLAVIVGRFQSPYLTSGHHHLIDKAFELSKNVAIFIGVSPSQPTFRNPLDYQMRRLMVVEAYPTAYVSPIMDRHDNDLWSSILDDKINSLLNLLDLKDAILCGCRDCFINSYTTKKFKSIEFDSVPDISSTQIRNEIINNPLDISNDFRRGVIYGIGKRIPSPYLTVDVAMIRDNNGKKEILLGKKPKENLFRFVGGFVDSCDSDIMNTAERELYEETGLHGKNFEIIGEFKIDDWRYLTDTEKIFTILYTCEYKDGESTPGDDIGELKWIDLMEFSTLKIMPIHDKLKLKILKHYKII